MTVPRPKVGVPSILFLLILGPVLGYLAYRVAWRNERQHALDRFRQYFAERVYALDRDLSVAREILFALRALYDSSEEVTREEFSTFARAILRRDTAVRAVEWLPLVEEEARQDHESEVQRAWRPDYRIRDRSDQDRMIPSPRRARYFPVCFVEPLDDNEAAVGFDVSSEPIRRAALEGAIATGEFTITAPIHLVQSGSDAVAFLGMLPVIRQVSRSDASIEDRIEGVLLLVLEVRGILEQSRFTWGRLVNPDMIYQITDDESPRSSDLIAASHDADAISRLDSSPFVTRVRFGSRTWKIAALPTRSFLSENSSAQPILLGIGAFVLWCMIGGFSIVLASLSQDRVVRHQDRIFRSVYHSLLDGVIVADAEGRLLLFNKAAERILGKGLIEVPTEEWPKTYGCYRPDRRTLFEPDQLPLARAIRGEEVKDEEIVIRRSGHRGETWISVNGTPLRYDGGALCGGVVVFRDLTQKKLSEENTRQLSNAVEITADTVFITDARGKILYVNPAFEATTGFPADEALGRTPRILRSGLHPDAYYGDLWKTILRGEVFRGTTINRKKDGSIYYSEQTITPMRDSADHVTHFVAVCKDMTERRELQEREIEMELAARVQEKLFPQDSPDLPDFDIAGAVLSAEATSGDYIDYISTEGAGTGIAIGDVSGHGLGPAMVMAVTRAYLRTMARATSDPGTILTRLNASIFPDLEDDRFVTLLLVVLDPDRARLEFASAGHTPAYILGRNGEVKAELARTGIPLGIEANRVVRTGPAHDLEPGDVLVLFTDGVTECRSREGEFLRARGAIEMIRDHLDEPARALVDRLGSGIRRFEGHAPKADDISIVVCKYDPASTNGGDASTVAGSRSTESSEP